LEQTLGHMSDAVFPSITSHQAMQTVIIKVRANLISKPPKHVT